MPKKSLLEIAKSAVPQHVRQSAKLVVQPDAGPAVALAGAKGRAGAKTLSTKTIAARLAAKLGVKATRRRAAQSGDVEFTEKTPLGKRSIVVQVRSGKVKQVIKRASRPRIG